MSSTRGFRSTARLGLTTTVFMFGLIVLGSVVRTTGSGLACPDWPLCGGRLIPPFEFHVMIEWSHRLVALLVTFLLLATALCVALDRTVRTRLGGLALLAVVLLAAQVLLGALTVWKLLDPAVVGGHLGLALLLFCAMVALTLIARSEAESGPGETRGARPAGLLPVFGLTTGVAFAQSLLGGIVSAHHAGLACPDWPTCRGQWFPPLEGLVGLQVLHRYGAYLLTGLVLFAAVRARTAFDRQTRGAAALALGLVVAQVALGVCNVLLGTPTWISAAHLAAAAAILATLVSVTFRVAQLPARVARLEPVQAG